jgi:hypothetical protein
MLALMKGVDTVTEGGRNIEAVQDCPPFKGLEEAICLSSFEHCLQFKDIRSDDID